MSLSNFDENAIYGSRMTLKKATNEYLLLEDENRITKEYIDLMSAYGACNFGHCNEKISPFKEYAADIAACFYPPEAEMYSRWLTNKLHLHDHEVLFQVGGSSAVSAAVSMSLRVKKGKIAYINGSFHGLGIDSLSITSTHKNFALQNTHLLESLEANTIQISVGTNPAIIDWEEISCLIFEPIQGANGYIPLDTKWLRELIRCAKLHNVVIIADEIQCGYFRHGVLSVSINNDLSPDIILFSKSMTNGLFPFSAVVYPKIFNSHIKENLFLAHTFQTSALGCYAAYSVSQYIDNHDIESSCKNIELLFVKFEERLKQCAPNIFNIHVTGPVLSFEVINLKSKELVKSCLKDGLLIFTGGKLGERVRIAPPITIDLSVLETCLEKLFKNIENILIEKDVILI